MTRSSRVASRSCRRAREIFRRRCASRTLIPPFSLSASNACSRLAELEHHEIGDVDDVVDRAKPDRFQFRAQPIRARADFDVLDPARGIERAFVRRAESSPRQSCVAGPTALRRPRQRRLYVKRSDLPRQAVMAQQIAAVRRDLDVENRVFGKSVRDRRADLSPRAKE